VRIPIAAFPALLILLPLPARSADLAFHTETVDSGGIQYVSIAIDSQGRPWIGYRRATSSYQGDCYVAVRDGGQWSIELAHVDTRPLTRLVLMPGDVPGIAWPANSGIMFISRPGAPGTPWVEEPFSGGFSPWAAQIECDQFGNVHAYNHWSYHYYGTLEYSQRAGSGWLTEQLDFSGSIFIAHNARADIAVGDDGTVHMAMVTDRQLLEGGGGGIEYWKRSGGQWSFEILEPGDWPSIVVTDLGPLIVYRGDGRLRFQWKVGGNWIDGDIDPYGGGMYAEIVQYLDGTLHVAHYDDGNGDLRYAVRSGNAWELHTVAAEGDVGAYASIALDVSGHPHFACRDATNGALEYATLDLATPVEAKSWGALKAIFDRR
jgi:hypothetical protein